MDKSTILNLRMNPSNNIDVSKMSESEFHTKIQKGDDDYKSHKTRNAMEAFDEFRRNIINEE